MTRQGSTRSPPASELSSLKTDTTKARKAFVAAARDAGLKVLRDDEQKPRTGRVVGKPADGAMASAGYEPRKT